MSDQPLIATVVVGPLQVNCYVAACPKTREALVIDPGDDGDRILEAIHSAGWQVVRIVNTHGHFDHIGGNRAVVEATGAELLIHELDLPLMEKAKVHAQLYGLPAEPSPPPGRLLKDGDSIAIGELSFEVIHLPGHSPGGIALLSGLHLFAGDVLFAGSIGRTDLPGGDHRALIDGIRKRLWCLPGETIVHPGHGPDTTIAREMRTNPYVAGMAD
ncbi:MAG: MBL fold metallo-hydrolase [Desulfuromonadales bacterium]|nr:MBL fold metallo-hydrolase [Desulfuromonadales bacterium]